MIAHDPRSGLSTYCNISIGTENGIGRKGNLETQNGLGWGRLFTVKNMYSQWKTTHSFYPMSSLFRSSLKASLAVAGQPSSQTCMNNSNMYKFFSTSYCHVYYRPLFSMKCWDEGSWRNMMGAQSAAQFSGTKLTSYCDFEYNNPQKEHTTNHASGYSAICSLYDFSKSLLLPAVLPLSACWASPPRCQSWKDTPTHLGNGTFLSHLPLFQQLCIWPCALSVLPSLLYTAR